MSGENESPNEEKLSVKLTKLEEKLAAYEEKIGLGKGGQIHQHLKMDWDQIQSLTLEQCGEIAAHLAVFSIHLQRIINKHTQRLNYCDSQLRIVCAKESHNYDGYMYKEKCDKVMVGDDYAAELFRTRVESQAVVDRLAYLPAKVEFFAKTLDNLQRSRGKYSEKFT